MTASKVSYAIESTVRKVAFRTHRAQAAIHTRKKQYVGGGQLRLVAGRRMLISEEFLQANLAELQEKAAGHILQVRTLDGRLLDLKTMIAAAPAPVSKVPHPLLDSLANDKQVGMYIPPYVGEDGAMPHVLAPGETPELLKHAAAEYDAPADPVSSNPTEADLDDAVTRAQEAASEETAPAGQDAVSSKGKKGRR